ncbi:MAG: hypothetical protein WBW48_20540, partial [Anaerolineae bacterium]
MTPLIVRVSVDDHEFAERMDPEYWDPAYLAAEAAMKQKWQLAPLGDFIKYITYGQVGWRIYSPTGSVRYI